MTFLNHLFGRVVCNILGSHTPDWTYATMTGSRPICKSCGKVLGGEL